MVLSMVHNIRKHVTSSVAFVLSQPIASLLVVNNQCFPLVEVLQRFK